MYNKECTVDYFRSRFTQTIENEKIIQRKKKNVS